MDFFAQLPCEIVLSIILKLDYASLVHLSQTSKSFYGIYSDIEFWRIKTGIREDNTTREYLEARAQLLYADDLDKRAAEIAKNYSSRMDRLRLVKIAREREMLLIKNKIQSDKDILLFKLEREVADIEKKIKILKNKRDTKTQDFLQRADIFRSHAEKTIPVVFECRYISIHTPSLLEYSNLCRILDQSKTLGIEYFSTYLETQGYSIPPFKIGNLLGMHVPGSLLPTFYVYLTYDRGHLKIQSSTFMDKSLDLLKELSIPEIINRYNLPDNIPFA